MQHVLPPCCPLGCGSAARQCESAISPAGCEYTPVMAESRSFWRARIFCLRASALARAISAASLASAMVLRQDIRAYHPQLACVGRHDCHASSVGTMHAFPELGTSTCIEYIVSGCRKVWEAAMVSPHPHGSAVFCCSSAAALEQPTLEVFCNLGRKCSLHNRISRWGQLLHNNVLEIVL